VKKYLTDAEISEQFDLGYHFKHVDTIFSACLAKRETNQLHFLQRNDGCSLIVVCRKRKEPKAENRGIVHVNEITSPSLRATNFAVHRCSSRLPLESGRCSSSPEPPTRTMGANQFDQISRLKGMQPAASMWDFFETFGTGRDAVVSPRSVTAILIW